MAKILVKTNKQRIACAEKEAYVTRTVSYLPIDEDALMEAAARNSGIKKSVIFSATCAMNNEFQNFLLKGHSVHIPQLGTFRFGINAKSVDTEEEISLDSVYRRKILFTPCVELKRRANEVELVSLQESITTVEKKKTESDTDSDTDPEYNG